MPERGVEPLLAVPAFMESLEDVDQLPLGETVQMRDDGVVRSAL